MKYNHIISGHFISRPNRFIATVEINGKEETVHVKNTGRCKELLQKGCTVYLSIAENPARKTKYDLIGVEKIREQKPTLTVNMDSQIPNDAAEEWLKKGHLFSKDAHIRREVRYCNSRFDLLIEDGDRKAFMEVKGVTLEKDGVALFPDAPTQRGVKHIKELISCKNEGFEAYILFVVQMKEVHLFRPNNETHPAFAEALKEAQKAGVHILVMDCSVAPNSIEISRPIPYEL